MIQFSYIIRLSNTMTHGPASSMSVGWFVRPQLLRRRSLPVNQARQRCDGCLISPGQLKLPRVCSRGQRHGSGRVLYRRQWVACVKCIQSRAPSSLSTRQRRSTEKGCFGVTLSLQHQPRLQQRKLIDFIFRQLFAHLRDFKKSTYHFLLVVSMADL